MVRDNSTYNKIRQFTDEEMRNFLRKIFQEGYNKGCKDSYLTISNSMGYCEWRSIWK